MAGAGDKGEFDYVVILDGSGNVVSSFGGGASQADNSAFTAGSSSAVPVMGIYEATPSTLTDGRVGVPAITANRVLKTALHAADGTAITTLPVSNAGLTELAAAINASSQMDVNVAANGIGLATSAKQDTIIGHVDGIEGLLTTIDGDTGNIVTSVQLLDDAAVVLGTATYTETTSTGLAIGAVRRDADTTLVDTTNEWGPLQMDANGRLKVEAFSGETLPVSVSGVATEAKQDTMITALQLIDDVVYVDDTATHSTGTSKGVGIMAAAVPTDTSISANDIGMVGMTTDRRMYVEASIAATQTLSTVTTVGTVTTLTGGGVAHDSGDSGNPHKIGMKAIDIGTQPTAVTANDRTDWYANRNGVPWMLGGSPAIVSKQLNVTDADGAQTDTALVTVSAGTAIVVTAFQAMCDGANTGDVAYRVGFGTANTPAADAAGIVSSHPGVKPGSGVVVGNGAGVIGMGASNEDLRLTCEDPAGGAIDIIVTYFTVLIG